MSQSQVSQALKIQRQLLDRIGDVEPVADRMIVERALILTRSAPSPATPSEVELAFQFWGHPEISGIDRSGVKVLGDGGKTSKALGRWARRWWESVAPQRGWFREAVRSIVDDADAARSRLRADLDIGVGQVLVLPRPRWGGRAPHADMFYICPTIESAMGLALSRLLAVSDALRACKLGSCGRLFLSYPPAGGGPRPSYCIPEHRERATQLSGAERTQRWRQKRAKA